MPLASVKDRSPVPSTTHNEADLDDVRHLVERAQAGDAAAFGLIYERYMTPVYQFVHHRVHGDRHLAEDLTADTFVRALRGLNQFCWQNRDLGAWLVTIARNLIADHYRSARVRRDNVADLADPAFVNTAASQESPEVTAMQRALRVQLLAAIGQLTAEHREVVMLRFYLGLSVTQTATVLGYAEARVRSRQHRAMRALERLLPVGVAA